MRGVLREWRFLPENAKSAERGTQVIWDPPDAHAS
jgi:hypothetical protein